MIKLDTFAKILDKFFNAKIASGAELRYRICVKLNFSLDVFLFTNEDGLSNDKYIRNEILKPETESSSVPGSFLAKKICQDVEWREINGITEEIALDVLEDYNSGNLSLNFRIYPLDEADNEYNEGLWISGKNNIDWGSRYRLASLINTVKSNIRQKPYHFPIVTFYSYKGGMGRTTTLIAYAIWLASHNKKVAIIDCDIEAPGYLNFFNLENQHDLMAGKKNGLVEFLADAEFLNYPGMQNNIFDDRDETIDISQYVISPDNGSQGGKISNVYQNIYIVPGGNLNDSLAQESSIHRRDYLEGLARINISNQKVATRGMSYLLHKINTAYNPDIVLIDSRTGFNDIFGTFSTGFADHVVGFFGLTSQNNPGLKQLIDTFYSNINNAVDGEHSSFGLSLVNSILPAWENFNGKPEWIKNQQAKINQYLDERANDAESEDRPTLYDLRRNHKLEMIGTANSEFDKNFIELSENGANEDYISLFEDLNSKIGLIFKQETESMAEEMSDDISLKADRNTESTEVADSTLSKEEQHFDCSNWSSLRLAKQVLKSLRRQLSTIETFAEECDFGVNQFLYRDCMAQIYNPKLFIICGYKGSGKTYLYRALGDRTMKQNEQDGIRDLIQARAIGQIDRLTDSEKSQYIDPKAESLFINIIGVDTKGSDPIANLKANVLTSTTYAFDTLWLTMLWNAILSNPDMAEIADKSPMKEMLFPNLKGKQALERVESIIALGVKAEAQMERDIERVNEHLANINKHLFVLYDRLDTVVEPQYWNRAVSPLVNSWRESYDRYSHIHPKIFIRTDLFGQIAGTNTERLRHNIVNIDWTIEDVFGYLMKLILSDDKAQECYWQIIRNIGRLDEQFIFTTKESIKNGHGQIRTMDLPSLKPLVEIFFGRQVTTTNDKKHPWDYFKRELSNAMGIVCLRPFINTLNKNTIERGLQVTKPYVREIIGAEIYANREVREQAANSYFDDLSSDLDFSEDLKLVRDFLNSDKGEPYRFKTLSERDFNDFLRAIIEEFGPNGQDKLTSIIAPADMQKLLFASGVMSEIIKPGRKIYRFAYMYHYPWGLKNSEFEKNDDSNRVADSITRTRRRNITAIQQPEVDDGIETSHFHKHSGYRAEKNNSTTVKRERVLTDGSDYVGKIVMDRNFKKIKCEVYPYPLRIEGCGNIELYEDDDVVFTAKSRPQDKDPNKLYWFATNVRIIES